MPGYCSVLSLCVVINILPANVHAVQRAAIGSFGGFLQAIVGAVAEEQYVSVEIFVKYCSFLKLS